jgi:DNA-binding helix-hairpin-helix protein with protein kinase domain
MKYLQEGELVNVEGGGQCKVVRVSEKKLFLGEGGQGVAYLVEFNGKKYALKWYKPDAIRNKEMFLNNLNDNIKGDVPSDKFVWPRYLVKAQDGAFGYLMDLFPSDYTSFTDILVKPAEAKFASSEATINAALNIINAFRDLHRIGKSYQDINDGGFVVRLTDGDVFICDCDNVAADGVSLGIAGKPGYMAPEIVTGGGRVKPSMETDQYSLSNVLFRLLMRGDPLAGKLESQQCLTEAMERKMYGEDPIFIFDPDNDTNRPVRGVHNNVINAWPRYPKYIQDAFIEAFTKGAKNPGARKTDEWWQRQFVRLKGEIIRCHKCKVTAFLSVFKQEGGELVCPACGNRHPMPKTISPNGFQLYLFPYDTGSGVKLLQGHTEATSKSLTSADYLTQTGVVIQNPKDPSRWGIRNAGTKSWFVKKPDEDKASELEAGKAVAVADGTEIEFPNGEKVKL